MTARRILGPLAAIVLIVCVGIAIFISVNEASKGRAARAVVTVSGLIGSEKQAFLQDPRVLAELRKNQIDLRVQTSGSRDMARRADIKSYDFAFPAGEPAAQKLKSVIGSAHGTTTPFFTPMAIASWKPIADILIANGIVHKEGGTYSIVDVPALLAAEKDGKRWSDFKRAGAYPVGKSVLITSTDVRTSNSGAMYLALASYVFNGNQVVNDRAQIAKIQPAIDGIFLHQGYQESSSAGPFEDYTDIGMGKSPLVMVYESQFIEYALAQKSAMNPNMVLLYPRPTVYTKHTFVPISDQGAKLGALLSEDPVLQHLAVEHGFRIKDSAYAQRFWKANGANVPAEVNDVIDPPSYEFLEQMIDGVDRAYKS